MIGARAVIDLVIGLLCTTLGFLMVLFYRRLGTFYTRLVETWIPYSSWPFGREVPPAVIFQVISLLQGLAVCAVSLAYLVIPGILGLVK